MMSAFQAGFTNELVKISSCRAAIRSMAKIADHAVMSTMGPRGYSNAASPPTQPTDQQLLARRDKLMQDRQNGQLLQRRDDLMAKRPKPVAPPSPAPTTVASLSGPKSPGL
jgi:hypothetical protein